ncbi:hypothetical protein TSUD_242570 [Trifolium subterraneum]|uniref:GH10 domain-containing protein n=1 Tax=Trifolium subterraneum TaxID=3900 RepID=A0A2Z6MFK0_TRISU|nr:hypothetical protein TSUD_242570 [Trifolium subterraneum]
MNIVLLLCVIILAGFEAEALYYDYSATIECLAHPQKPLYNGGIIENPELNDGLKAWIQVSEADVPVIAMVKTTKEYKFSGAIDAKPNCWSMLKGGFTADTTEVVELYFQSNTTSVEIWIDNISLQPFTEKEWSSHQEQTIEKARKRKVVFQALDEQGNPLQNASVNVTMNKLGFPFGSSINKNILSNNAYHYWFASRFTVTTFEDEMKWYTNEYAPGKENYFEADAMLRYAKKHGIFVRGHNVIWDDSRYQPNWVSALSPSQLNVAVQRRVNSIVQRYKGQLIGWDVVNENLHFSFFESKLGQDFSARMYNQVHNIDPRTTLFLNDYNTIEESRDGVSSPSRYIQKIRQIQSSNRQLPLAIGLESHFPSSPPNLPYMRASLDILRSAGFPIWITELDVASQPNQAGYFEQVLREAHSHPGIRGIVMWTAWSPHGCYRMCLTDNNFKNLPTGDVVDKLLKEWGKTTISTMTDKYGFLETSLFHGEYEVEISHPVKKNLTFTHKIQVLPKDESKKTRQFIKLSV